MFFNSDGSYHAQNFNYPADMKYYGYANSLNPIGFCYYNKKTITWSISFIHQDYERLNLAAKKFIAFMIENTK